MWCYCNNSERSAYYCGKRSTAREHKYITQSKGVQNPPRGDIVRGCCSSVGPRHCYTRLNFFPTHHPFLRQGEARPSGALPPRLSSPHFLLSLFGVMPKGRLFPPTLLHGVRCSCNARCVGGDQSHPLAAYRPKHLLWASGHLPSVDRRIVCALDFHWRGRDVSPLQPPLLGLHNICRPPLGAA